MSKQGQPASSTVQHNIPNYLHMAQMISQEIEQFL